MEEREKWLDTLDKIYTEVNDNFEKEMSKYFYPNGPVIAYGYTIDGVLKVAIEKGQKIDAAKENELYDLFSNYGQNIAVKDVPLIIVYEDLPTPTSRTSSWRPIIGGIKICTEKPDGIKQSTLGFLHKLVVELKVMLLQDILHHLLGIKYGNLLLGRVLTKSEQ